jgi:hypothetical protein
MEPAELATCTTVFPMFDLGHEDPKLCDAMVFATIDRPHECEARFVFWGSEEIWKIRINRPNGQV